MSQKYDVVVTNPPYMGNKGINDRLKNYISEKFEDVKSDLFSVFIVRNFDYAKPYGHLGYMTPFVWMFISSYEKLREIIIKNKSITSLVQLEYSGFEEATVPICTFTIRNTYLPAKGEYIRLSDFRGAEFQPIKTLEAVRNPNVNYRYSVGSSNFEKIPGMPIAYWVSDNIIKIFKKGKRLKTIGDTRQGMATSDNNRFLRLWFEVSLLKIGFNCPNADAAFISKKKWFPYNKGGFFRKWYGNNEYVVNWENNGKEILDYATKLYRTPTRTIKSISEYFKKCISWSKISSGSIAFRFYGNGYIFDVAGCSIFFKDEEMMKYLLGSLNTKIYKRILEIISPTLNYEAGQIANLPVIIDKNCKTNIDNLVYNNIQISRADWDSFETSWDFKKHPLLTHKGNSNTIEQAFNNWSAFAEKQFNQLKDNEEELNRIFIEIYGLQDELTPEVEDKDVTIRKADRVRDIKSLSPMQ